MQFYIALTAGSFFLQDSVLSEQQVKNLLKDDKLSDEEILKIRDGFYNLAEVIFTKWQEEKQKIKNIKIENKEIGITNLP